ncbi:MAG: PilZ domain-containing protein [Chloroflexi bacterium]|nr:PilZ domain-containing protein [Chloroflexota bacterium]
MPKDDQRRSQRKLVSLRAFIFRETTSFLGVSIPARTINLSHTGALIESAERLFSGEDCTFELVTDDGRRAEISGRIVWVKQETDNVYRAGVAFRNLSPDEEYLLDLELVRKSTG